MRTRPAAGHPSQPGGSHDCPVASAAHARLHNSPYLALRRVTCILHEGRLVLSGEVPSFYMVQVAQTLVAGLPGVEQVESHLHVSGCCTLSNDDPPDRKIPSPKSRPRFAGPSWDEALSLSAVAPSV